MAHHRPIEGGQGRTPRDVSSDALAVACILLATLGLLALLALRQWLQE